MNEFHLRQQQMCEKNKIHTHHEFANVYESMWIIMEMLIDNLSIDRLLHFEIIQDIFTS